MHTASGGFEEVQHCGAGRQGRGTSRKCRMQPPAALVVQCTTRHSAAACLYRCEEDGTGLGRAETHALLHVVSVGGGGVEGQPPGGGVELQAAAADRKVHVHEVQHGGQATAAVACHQRHLPRPKLQVQVEQHVTGAAPVDIQCVEGEQREGQQVTCAAEVQVPSSGGGLCAFGMECSSLEGVVGDIGIPAPPKPAPNPCFLAPAHPPTHAPTHPPTQQLT